MKRYLVILGAGGHGRVIADTAHRQGYYHILGFLDDRLTGPVNGLPCLGTISVLPDLVKEYGPRKLSVIIGIGDNSTRQRLAFHLQALVEEGTVEYATIIDPSAVVSQHAVVGPGTVVLANGVVAANAYVGHHVIVNTAATIDHDCTVGDFAHLSPGVHLAGNVSVSEGAHLGVGAVVIPGVSIGAWSVVGAGSVVTRDVPPKCVSYGVPSKTRRLL